MRKIILVLVFILGIPFFTLADNITLDNTETLDVPTATQLKWYVNEINATSKTLSVKYQWRDSSNTPIRDRDSARSWHTWICKDIAPNLVENCTDIDKPYAGCTGVGTGVGLYAGDTCFADVFGFTIRAQDVGTGIGVGLRTLIWGKMRPDILTGVNDGSFD